MDANNGVTQYAYDNENNLTNITDAATHPQTTFQYDTNGQVIQTNFPSGWFETYSYDLDGNLTSKTDRNGHGVNYTYDFLNRLTTKQYQDGSTVSYTYDLGNRLARVVDVTGTYMSTYDNMGRLTQASSIYSFVPGKTFAVGYGYDAGSNRTSMADPQSASTSYAFDTLNRLITLTYPARTNYGFAYDALGRRTQLTRPNSVATSYQYDSLSRLLNILHTKSSATLDGATYVYDAAGNRTSKTDKRTNVTSTFSYDPLYELTQVSQGATTTESYGYDMVGNRLSSLGVSPYAYNTSNELSSKPDATYTYDNNGNMLTKLDSTGTTTYSWDFENRLTSVALPGSGGTVTFKYDPFGRRIQKSSSSGTTNYVYDGSNILEEVDNSGNVLARYVQGQGVDEPLAEVRSSVTSYYETDGLGSVTSLSNSSGVAANTYVYDSFGRQTASSGTIVNPFRYTAREYDSETGLNYYRARYYDSSVGRFMSEDPIGFGGGNNFYRYAANEPTLLVDPSGLCASGFRNLSTDERTTLIQEALSSKWNGWGFDLNLRIDWKNKKVGCSAFVFTNLKRAKIPAPWTSAYNIDKGAPFYSPIDPQNVKPGDLVQFNTGGAHLAIATSADPLNGYDFVGSQVSTGPAEVKNWTSKKYWTSRIAGYYEICVPTK